MRGIMKISREALLVWLLLAVTYAYFYQDPVWNGNSRFALAVSFVQSGSLNIDAFHDRPDTGLATGEKAFHNDHYYTDKAIGSSRVAAAAYFPLYWLMRLSGLSLPPEVIKQILTFLYSVTFFGHQLLGLIWAGGTVLFGRLSRAELLTNLDGKIV